MEMFAYTEDEVLYFGRSTNVAAAVPVVNRTALKQYCSSTVSLHMVHTMQEVPQRHISGGSIKDTVVIAVSYSSRRHISCNVTTQSGLAMGHGLGTKGVGEGTILV